MWAPTSGGWCINRKEVTIFSCNNVKCFFMRDVITVDNHSTFINT